MIIRIIVKIFMKIINNINNNNYNNNNRKVLIADTLLTNHGWIDKYKILKRVKLKLSNSASKVNLKNSAHILRRI